MAESTTPTKQSFKFDDTFMDTINGLALESLTVSGNSASAPLPLRQLKSQLSTGQSFRFPAFTMTDARHPCLQHLRFELRLYPSGQFEVEPSPPSYKYYDYRKPEEYCRVYLVLIECNAEDKLPEMEITVSLMRNHGIHSTEISANKRFDWSVKGDRWVKMDIPTRKIASTFEPVLLTMSIRVKSAWENHAHQQSIYNIRKRPAEESLWMGKSNELHSLNILNLFIFVLLFLIILAAPPSVLNRPERRDDEHTNNELTRFIIQMIRNNFGR